MNRDIIDRALLADWVAVRDPNLFIESAFDDPSGQPLRQGQVHRDLQAFLSAHQHALVELPRDHGKSTQLCARVVWELARDPSLRIKIVCANEALAAERGRFIRTTIEQNKVVQLFFTKLHPATPWSDTRFTIQRPANVLGPSVLAVGVGGGSTGTRADLLICDDIVDVKAMHSRTERERVKNHFRDNLMNLLEPHGRFWGLCTPWHRDDLNAELKRNPAFAHFRRAVGPDFDPVWPERWPREALQARCQEIGSLSFARGYRLEPLTEEQALIPFAWVRYWHEQPVMERIVLAVDPALSTNPRADRSAIVVLGLHGHVVHCLATSARRVNTPDLLTLLASYDAIWRPDVILFEANAAFRGIADLMSQRCSFGPRIKTIVQTKEKASRIAAFSVRVENGTFRLHGHGSHVDPSQQELLDEMLTFPLGEHDDLIDATAFGTAYLLDQREPRVWC